MSIVSTSPQLSRPAPLALVPDERDQMRIHWIRKFLDQNTVALHDTLQAAAGEEGGEVLEELVGALSERWPDPVVVTSLVERARDFLADATVEHLDRMDPRTRGSASLHDRVRWYGARLSDLVAPSD